MLRFTCFYFSISLFDTLSSTERDVSGTGGIFFFFFFYLTWALSVCDGGIFKSAFHLAGKPQWWSTQRSKTWWPLLNGAERHFPLLSRSRHNRKAHILIIAAPVNHLFLCIPIAQHGCPHEELPWKMKHWNAASKSITPFYQPCAFTVILLFSTLDKKQTSGN